MFTQHEYNKQINKFKRGRRLGSYTCYTQGIGIKGKEMALVWHEKASRTAL